MTISVRNPTYGIRTTFLLFACSALAACGGGSDGGSHEQPASELDLQDVAASIPVSFGEGMHPAAVLSPPEPLEDEEMVDKIRGGNAIDYDAGVGNGIVRLGLPTMFCTGQVVNNYFILTAAHCLTGNAANINVVVQFTRRDGSRVDIYNGTAQWAVVGNNLPVFRDVGLLFLPNRINTCNNTVAWCAANRPDIPINSQFQYYDSPAQNVMPVNPPYLVAGYGRVDTTTTAGRGVLRSGYTSLSGFTRSSSPAGGLAIRATWQEGTALSARGCDGDSGGPLIPVNSPFGQQKPSPGRIFHTGILSGGDDCNNTSGQKFYTALDTDRALWVVLMLYFTGQSLGFTCSDVPSLPSNVYGFGCGNG